MTETLNIKWKLLGTEKNTIQEDQVYLKEKEINLVTKQRPKQAEKDKLEDNEMMQNQVQSLISERDERT